MLSTGPQLDTIERRATKAAVEISTDSGLSEMRTQLGDVATAICVSGSVAPEDAVLIARDGVFMVPAQLERVRISGGLLVGAEIGLKILESAVREEAINGR